MDGDPVAVPADAPGRDGEVLFTGAAGQTVTVDLLATSFEDPCDVHVTLKTPAGDTLVKPTCAGDAAGTLLPSVKVTATALLHLFVDVDDHTTGTVSVHVTGKGTASITPNGPARRVTVAPGTRTELALPAQAGDVLGVDVRPAVDGEALWAIEGQLARGSDLVDTRHPATAADRLVWAVRAATGGELRLWLTTSGDTTVDLDVILTSTAVRDVALKPGVPTTVSLRSLGSTTTLAFEGRKDSRPVLDLTTTAGAGDLPATLTLLDPTGRAVDTRSLLPDLRTLTFPPLSVSGTWRIAVQAGTDAGRLTLTLRVGTVDPIPVTVGEPQRISFTDPGQLVDLRVVVARGDVLSVRITDFAVTTPDGTAAPVTVSDTGPGGGLRRWGTVAEDDVLDAPGPASQSGDRVLHFSTVAAGAGSFTVTVDTAAETPRPLTVGVPVTQTITAGAGSTLYAFPVEAGQVPVVDVTALDLHVGNVDGAVTATGRLAGAVHGQDLGSRGTVGELRAPRQTRSAGTYLLRVGGYLGARGTVTFVVRMGTEHAEDLALGESATVDLDADVPPPWFRVPLRHADIPFLVVDAVTRKGTATVGIHAAEGNRVSNSDVPQVPALAWLTRPIPKDGAYTVRFTGTGAFTFHLEVEAAAPSGTVQEGKPVTVTTTARRHTASVTVPMPATKVPYLTVTASEFGGVGIRMVDSARGEVPLQGLVQTATTWTAAPRVPRHAGPLLLTFTSSALTTLRFTVSVRYASTVVQAMTPGHPLTLDVAPATAEVRLAFDAKAGQSLALYARTARFTQNGRSAGLWGQITRPDGSAVADVSFWGPNSYRTAVPLDATGRWTVRLRTDGLTGLLKVTPYLGVVHDAALPADPDGSVTATFASHADVYRYRFTLPAGRFTSVPILGMTLATRAPAGAQVPPAEDAMVAELCRTGAQRCEYVRQLVDPPWPHPVTGDAVTTAVDGTFTLTLTPGAFTTGSVVLSRHEWGADPSTSLRTGVPTTVRLKDPQRPVDLDLGDLAAGTYLVEVTDANLPGGEGARVTAALTGTAFPEHVDLTDEVYIRDGVPFRTTATLQGGPWHLTLSGLDNTVGTLTVTVSEAPEVTFRGGTAATVPLPRPGDHAAVTLTGPSRPGTSAVLIRRTSGTADRVDVTAEDGRGSFVRCTALVDGGAWCGDTRGPLALPVTVHLSPHFAGTGTWAARLAGTPPQKLTWEVGAEHTVTVPPGAEGQDVMIDVSEVPDGSQLALAITDWSLRSSGLGVDHARDVELVARRGDSTSRQGFVSAPVTHHLVLPAQASGPVRVHLRTAYDTTGSFTATLLAAPPVRASVTLGTPVPVTLDQPGQRGEFAFTPPARQWVTVHASGSTFMHYRLCIDSVACTPILGEDDADATLRYIQRKGRQHTLTVEPQGLETGSVTVTLGTTITPPVTP